MVATCPRCGAELHPFQGERPAFCPACGLPQLRISSDATLDSQEADAAHPQGSVSSTMNLPRALRVVGAAGVLAVGSASLLPGALVAGAINGLVLLLTPMLVLGTVMLYSRTRPPAQLSPTGGARLGALLGLWMGALVAAVTGVAGFVLRYGFHSHAMDQKIEQAAAQVPMQLRMAGTQPPELLQLLQAPEFRAGSFILGHALSLLLLVAGGWVCGWMAATVLRLRRERTIN